MRRAIAVLLLLSGASCGKTPAERGAELFRPSAQQALAHGPDVQIDDPAAERVVETLQQRR